MLALFALLPLLLPAGASPIAPRATSQYIQSYRNGECLAISGSAADGTPVVTVPCSGGSLWDISPGNGQVVLHGTSYCLDAGTDPHNNVPSKIWTCYPGVTQQQWYYTDDNRIAITGGDQCLDEDATGPQTYQCTTGNTNQIWYALSSAPGGPTTTSTSTSASASATPPPSPPPTGPGSYIQSYRNGECLALSGSAGDGTPLVTAPCSGAPLWNISPGNGQVVLHGTNYCLDAGTNPSNNVPSKIWTCYPGLTQQQWYYTDDNRIAITGGNQCLDEDATGPQTYQCTSGDANQIWYALSSAPSGPTTTTTKTTARTTSTSTSTSTSAASSPSPSGGLAKVYSSCVVENMVALTFDDGPYIYEQDIVNKLNNAGIKATFFVNGNNWDCIYNYVDQIRNAYASGHMYGDHTWDHPDLTTLDADQISTELSLVETALQRIIGVQPAFMRPPYGNLNNLALQVIAEHGMSAVLWDTDDGDSTGSTVAQSEAYYASVVAKHPKNILALNHETYETTADDVLPYAITLLQDAGYTFGTVAECLGLQPYQWTTTPGTPDDTWTC